MYASNRKDKSVLELVYDNTNKIFRTSDNTMGIHVSNKIIVSMNAKTKVGMTVQPHLFELLDKKRNCKIKVIHDVSGYKFFGDDLEFKSIEELSIIIKFLKLKAPGYYNELLKEQEFQKVLSSIQQARTEAYFRLIQEAEEEFGSTKKR